jgi:hypothetical protein
MTIQTEDLKQLKNLIGLLKLASFKDVSSAQVLSIALTIQWVGEIKERMEKELMPAPQSETLKTPIQEAPKPSKGKK